MPESLMHIEAAYHEHGPALLAYLRRHAGRAAAADDLLQETFVQALQTWLTETIRATDAAFPTNTSSSIQ